jgi:hypothetical protein
MAHARESDPTWREKRDAVIRTAYSQGASIRLLADVFDLSPSRICAIVKSGWARISQPLPPSVIPFGRTLEK